MFGIKSKKAEGPEPSELEKRSLGKVTKYLYLYIFIGEVFYQLDRTNISMAKLTMAPDLGMDMKTYGFAAGIFGLGAFLFQMPAAKGFERFGARKWITTLMISWGFMCFLQGFVQNGTQLSILRFFLGICEAGFLPALYVIISTWFRGAQQGAAQATRMVGLSFASIVGGPFAGWVLGTTFLDLAGWRSLYLIEGSLTMLWGVASLLIIYDSPRKAKWLKDDEKDFMDEYLGEYENEKKKSGAIEKATFWDAIKNKDILLLVIGFGFSGWVASTMMFFIPTLLKESAENVSEQMVGYLMMAPFIVYAIVGQVWGRHADRTERHWHTLIPLGWTALGVILYPVSVGNAILAMVTICIIKAGTAGFIVNFWAAANLAVGKNTLAKSTALIVASSQGFSFIAPVYFGWTRDITGDVNLGMYSVLVALVITFFCLNTYFCRHKDRMKAAMEQAKAEA